MGTTSGSLREQPGYELEPRFSEARQEIAVRKIPGWGVYALLTIQRIE